MAWIEPITYVDKTPTEVDEKNVTHIHYTNGSSTSSSKVGCYTNTNSYQVSAMYRTNWIPDQGIYEGGCEVCGQTFSGEAMLYYWNHPHHYKTVVRNYYCSLTQGTSVMGVIKLIKTGKDLSVTVENGESGTVKSTISYLWSTGETTDTIRTHGHGTYYCDVTVTETLSNQSHTERVSCVV